jgi:hypothetical protein
MQQSFTASLCLPFGIKNWTAWDVINLPSAAGQFAADSCLENTRKHSARFHWELYQARLPLKPLVGSVGRLIAGFYSGLWIEGG